MSLRSKVCEIIHSRPGVTQLEIATLIYGSSADQGQVNRICRDLIRGGHVQRTGKGGPHDPFTYTWVRPPRSSGLNPLGGQPRPSV